jgi:hypothetical protein
MEMLVHIKFKSSVAGRMHSAIELVAARRNAMLVDRHRHDALQLRNNNAGLRN